MRREIPQDLKQGIRFRKDAIAALQEAAEDFIAEKFEDNNKMAIHTKRVAVMPKDMKLKIDVRREEEKLRINMKFYI